MSSLRPSRLPSRFIAASAGLLLLVASAQAQEVRREVRKAIVVNGEGKVIQIDGDESETFAWVAKEGDGDNQFEFFDFATSFGGGYLGVETRELTDPLRAHFGVPEGEGVMIAAVEEGSPAEAAGVLPADIVTSVNGEVVRGQRDLGRLVRALEAGAAADLEIWRDRRLEQISAVVAERERNVFKIGENGTVRIQVQDAAEADVQVIYDEFEGPALEKLREFIGSGEWLTRLENIEGLDFRALQERMQELEKELVEIEVRLQEIDPEEKDG
ncbi:MAG: PDZ domain-containing protein [Acidobacteriota bacterium]